MTKLVPGGASFDGTALLPVWARMAAVEAQMEAADRRYQRTNVLTDRRLDGADRPGLRLYILASSLIGKARESQLLLEQTFTTPGINVFPHATPNIIRPAFEAAATALWILDGETPLERRLRGLRNAWEDHRQSQAWAGELMLPMFMTQEEIATKRASQAAISKRYRDDAASLGLSWSRVTQRFNLRDVIGEFGFVRSQPEMAPFLRAIWRRMSGVQHGLSYATLLGTERHQQVAIPGGFETLVLTDDESLLTDCRASALMQIWAMQTFIRRTEKLST